MANEEVTATEKRALELRIMEFQQACRLIKKDFQNYVKGIIQLLRSNNDSKKISTGFLELVLPC